VDPDGGVAGPGAGVDGTTRLATGVVAVAIDGRIVDFVVIAAMVVNLAASSSGTVGRHSIDRGGNRPRGAIDRGGVISLAFIDAGRKADPRRARRAAPAR
jgi:hypothetical protein